MISSIRRQLPKAKLFYIKVRPRLIIPAQYNPVPFAKFRLANAMFVWIGPIEVGWRMPWLEHSARALYPQLFKAN